MNVSASESFVVRTALFASGGAMAIVVVGLLLLAAGSAGMAFVGRDGGASSNEIERVQDWIGTAGEAILADDPVRDYQSTAYARGVRFIVFSVALVAASVLALVPAVWGLKSFDKLAKRTLWRRLPRLREVVERASVELLGDASALSDRASFDLLFLKKREFRESLEGRDDGARLIELKDRIDAAVDADGHWFAAHKAVYQDSNGDFAYGMIDCCVLLICIGLVAGLIVAS